LERSAWCPVCAREFDTMTGVPIVFPNFTASAIADSIRSKAKVARSIRSAAKQCGASSSEGTSDELVDLAMSLDAGSIDRVMDVLRKRREQIALGDVRRKNILMNEFLDEMISRREHTIRQAQHELNVLKHDRQAVQTILKVDKNCGVSSSHRMVPDAGGLLSLNNLVNGGDLVGASSIRGSSSQQTPSAIQSLADSGTAALTLSATDEMEMSKYRSRLQQHMNGLEQAYILKR
uniref:PKcGMP_CC domain-containing protein n=2 Tax=Anisakis simplex TaxID=6269 RepID=A0A0M3J6L7_ANISI